MPGASDRPPPDDDAATAVAGWMRLADEALGAAAPDVARRRTTTGAVGQVLVVEDDATTRDAVVSALEDAGIVCWAAADGTAALAECQRRDPAVVVLDLALPGLDGARFADAYRRIPGSAARFVVISATDRGSETAARIGANAYLSKPFRLNSLVDITRRLLRGDA